MSTDPTDCPVTSPATDQLAGEAVADQLAAMSPDELLDTVNAALARRADQATDRP